MDFVSRDGLVSAMNAWVLDKVRPLGDILRDQGALAPDEHDLLEKLVQKHLERHGNDPERSLAALPLTDPLRQAIRSAAGGDDQAAASLSTLETTGAFAPRPAGGSRYCVLRPHARGGLGEVFV